MRGPKAESHHTVRQQYHGDCDQRDMRDPSLPPNSKQKPLKFLRNLEREKSQQWLKMTFYSAQCDEDEGSFKDISWILESVECFILNTE